MINKVNYLLKKSGLSITPLRKEVLVFLLENEVSSLDDIKKNIKEFDRVTLYRTIKILIKFNIIKELSFQNKKFVIVVSMYCVGVNNSIIIKVDKQCNSTISIHTHHRITYTRIIGMKKTCIRF